MVGSNRDEFLRNAHDPNWMPHRAGRSVELIQAWLEGLPIHRVAQGESLFDVFAQEDVKVGEKLRVLPCGHKFRNTCIGNLFVLMPRSQCPECRQDYTQVSPTLYLI